MKSRFIQGVEVINVCEVIKAIYGEGYWTLPLKDRPSYSDRCKAVAKWAAENGADIYAEDRQDYSETRAAFRAWKSGFRRVVVEDLSLPWAVPWIACVLFQQRKGILCPGNCLLFLNRATWPLHEGVGLPRLSPRDVGGCHLHAHADG